MQVKMFFVTLNRNNRNSSVMETSDLDITDYSQPDIRPPDHPGVKQIKEIVWQTFHKYETFPEETLE